MADFGLSIVSCPYDSRAWLFLDAEGVNFYIEFHEETHPGSIAYLKREAWIRGYTVDIDGDPYDMVYEMGGGMLRLYLTYKETMPDVQGIPYPDLSLTAYGPLSGEMEVV